LNIVLYFHKEKKYSWKGVYDESQTYKALSCECLNDDNTYNVDNIAVGVDKCSHSTMISDYHMIDYVHALASQMSQHEDISKYSSAVRSALEKYDSKINYENECNESLLTK